MIDFIVYIDGGDSKRYELDKGASKWKTIKLNQEMEC